MSNSVKSVSISDILNKEELEDKSIKSTLTICLCDDPPSIDSIEDDYEMDDEEIKLIQEFKENVIKYVGIDDIIRKKKSELKEIEVKNKERTVKLKKEIKDIEQKKIPYEKFVLHYLEQIGEDVIDISDGKLKKSKSERKGKITKKIIEDSLKVHLRDTLLIAEIMETIEKKLPRTVNIGLKRTSVHKKK